MKLKEVIDALERLAPLRLQDEWDNSGLQDPVILFWEDDKL